VKLAILPLTLRPMRIILLIASRLATGSAPGSAIHTSQVFELGILLNGSFKHEHHILDAVFSSACISIPIVTKYFFSIDSEDYNIKIKSPVTS
jgi:hypothetical protein